MTPYYSDKYVQIFLGDCREVLPQLDVKFDALITDPPFGIGFNYDCGAEKCDTPDKYWEWLEPLYTLAQESLRSGAFIAVWQTQLYFRYFWEWFGDDIHIYIGAKNFVQLRKVAIQYAYDPIILLYEDGEKLCPTKPKRNLDYFVANTAKWVTQTEDIVRQHPCPRPIDQVTEIISNFTIDNANMLDIFSGAGTILLAAKRLNRCSVGIEISEKYCEIAAKRCMQEVMELGI